MSKDGLNDRDWTTYYLDTVNVYTEIRAEFDKSADRYGSHVRVIPSDAVRLRGVVPH